MPTRNRWLVISLAGLFLTAAAGLAYAAASAEAAAGSTATATGVDAGNAPQVRHSRIKLVLDHGGAAEQIELVDLHEMAVGESRDVTTESGVPVVVTRDADGFEIDLDGNKVRLGNEFEAPAGGDVQLTKRVFVRHGGAGAHAFAFATGGSELPALALPVEATIERLEASAKFQALDAATRATVLEALRESAPKTGALIAGEPGAKTMVLEIEDTDGATAADGH